MAVFLRFAILAFLALTLWRILQRALNQKSSAGSSTDKEERSKALDPYLVLGIHQSASPAEIKQAYKKALNEYHPDKTSHLGEDLQKLAQQKTQQIVEAYNQLI